MNQVNLRHARTKKQRRIMEQIKRDGACPFCHDFCGKIIVGSRYHTKPIIRETKWWAVTENFEPYEGTTCHLLIVYKFHVIGPEQIDPRSWEGLGKILRWIIAHFNLPAGGFFFRFGDTDYTGAS